MLKTLFSQVRYQGLDPEGQTVFRGKKSQLGSALKKALRLARVPPSLGDISKFFGKKAF